MTRRDAIARLFGRARNTSPTVAHNGNGADLRVPPDHRENAAPPVAVVAARRCLSLPPGFCRTCIETCPVPGAMVLSSGVPVVNAALCTGCSLCHDACPAPGKAILMLQRKPRPEFSHAC